MKNYILPIIITFIMINVITASEALSCDVLIYEKTLSSESGQDLIVNSVAGNIKVITSSSNEVTVRAYGTEETKDKLDITAESSSDGVTVEVKKIPGIRMNNLNIRLEITVPSQYNVSLNTGGGNLSVASLIGKMELKTMGGNINLEGNNGDAFVVTKGGNITVISLSGNLKAETNGGNVKISSSNGYVNSTTMGGNITLAYSGNNKGIELNTSAGNIKLEIPTEFDAKVNLSTTVGKISGDLGCANDKHIGCNLKTTVGNGGNKLICSTQAGSITVTKK